MSVFEQRGSSAQTIKDILEGAGASNEPEEETQLSEKEHALMAIIPSASVSTVRRLLHLANGSTEVALTLHFDMNLSSKTAPTSSKKLKNKRVSEAFQKGNASSRHKMQKNEITKGMNTISSYFGSGRRSS